MLVVTLGDGGHFVERGPCQRAACARQHVAIAVVGETRVVTPLTTPVIELTE